MITAAALMQAGIAAREAVAFEAPLSAACQRFDINTPARIAGFIAQCRVESASFTRLEENLRYRTPKVLDANFRAVRGLDDAALLIQLGPQAIANRVYADRLGNGNEASGDGWRFRGRGLKQLTGRDNYSEASQALARPYLKNPDLVAQPEDACLTAAWFWHTNKCNHLADAGQWDAITRIVNGPAMLQADERRRYAEAGASVFA
ncbi:MAG: glycoside hydrolase family 19 protein [Candidatus Limnocylindrus sp.]